MRHIAMKLVKLHEAGAISGPGDLAPKGTELSSVVYRCPDGQIAFILSRSEPHAPQLRQDARQGPCGLKQRVGWSSFTSPIISLIMNVKHAKFESAQYLPVVKHCRRLRPIYYSREAHNVWWPNMVELQLQKAEGHGFTPRFDNKEMPCD